MAHARIRVCVTLPGMTSGYLTKLLVPPEDLSHALSDLTRRAERYLFVIDRLPIDWRAIEMADSNDHADNVDDIIVGIVERWVRVDGPAGTVAIG